MNTLAEARRLSELARQQGKLPQNQQDWSKIQSDIWLALEAAFDDGKKEKVK